MNPRPLLIFRRSLEYSVDGATVSEMESGNVSISPAPTLGRHTSRAAILKVLTSGARTLGEQISATAILKVLTSEARTLGRQISATAILNVPTSDAQTLA